MIRVALTGGIATGKSYVLARLASCGIPTVDADGLVHAALDASSPAVSLIQSRFGPSVLAPDGSIDRRALAAVVFADARARKDLEDILHPVVYQQIDRWFTSLGDRQPAPRLAVADIPLLYETGHEGFFDAVVVTACNPELQAKRLVERNGMTEAAARQRLEAQWPIEEKVRRADYVIDTGGTFEETDRQVDEIVRRLRA